MMVTVRTSELAVLPSPQCQFGFFPARPKNFENPSDVAVKEPSRSNVQAGCKTWSTMGQSRSFHDPELACVTHGTLPFAQPHRILHSSRHYDNV
jgi:hypothetical protein